MEKLGKEKRHLLTDNLTDVKDSQTEAKEEFTDTLIQIQAASRQSRSDAQERFRKMEPDVDALIRDMNRAIPEANRFIEYMLIDHHRNIQEKINHES